MASSLLSELRTLAAEQEALPDVDQLTHALGSLVELTDPEDATGAQ